MKTSLNCFSCRSSIQPAILELGENSIQPKHIYLLNNKYNGTGWNPPLLHKVCYGCGDQSNCTGDSKYNYSVTPK